MSYCRKIWLQKHQIDSLRSHPYMYIPPSNPCYLLFGLVGLYLECDLYIQRVVHATHDALWEEPSNLASFANQMNGEDQLSRILQLTEGRVITSY